MPTEAIVPLEETRHVLFLCSRFAPRFEPQIYVQELAFAHEMAARNRSFAVADDPSILFDKAIAWFLPGRFVSPRLWDYSRQAHEFAAGLERQGNRLFCSADETAYWENKAHMHRKLAERGIPTPNTKVITAESREATEFDIEPVLIKEEHSAGSAGIQHFPTAAAARKFVMEHPFRPTESLIMQEEVEGATRDLRLTMVGDKAIKSTTYWRTKSTEALSRAEWTTTATTYDSVVLHDDVPDSTVPMAAEWLRALGVRTAGIDLMWTGDDLSHSPVVLELSPYYQPNPPKPERYAAWTYKRYKREAYMKPDGYLFRQYAVFRDIAGEILDQQLY
jgi:glutathione synthase/RimK-type ligase-like ATP-grasp enzyme